MNSESKETLQSRLVRDIVSVWFVGIVLVTVVLTASFYYRDRDILINETRERAKLIRASLLASMVDSSKPEAVRETLANFKRQSRFGLRMVESLYVLRQYGSIGGGFPRDKVEEDVLDGVIPEYSDLTGTTFRFVTPFITDENCGKCHENLEGQPLPAGKVIGLAEFVYGVSEYRNASLRLLAETEMFIILIMSATAYMAYVFFNRNVLKPLGEITGSINLLGAGGRLEKPLSANSVEMGILVDEVRKMAASIEEKRLLHEKELDEERKKTDQISKFVFYKTNNIGITDPKDISLIISRLSRSVGEVEKSKMIEIIAEFVTLEKKELVIGNNVELIRPISLYLTDLIAGKKGNIKKGSIELVLEEVLTNAIAHGNLELISTLKDEDFSEFERVLRERAETEPYKTRRVHISYDFNGVRATFKISDDGVGFDWGSYLKKEAQPDLLVHGRGLIIIRAFSSSVSFNDKGNEIVVSFDL